LKFWKKDGNNFCYINYDQKDCFGLEFTDYEGEMTRGVRHHLGYMVHVTVLCLTHTRTL